MQCSINNKPVMFNFDTGSFLSTINIKELEDIPNVVINETYAKAKGYSNNPIKFLGEAKLKLKFRDRKITHRFCVVGGNDVSLLGRDICSQLKFEIQIAEAEIFSIENKSVLEKFKDYLSPKFISCVKDVSKSNRITILVLGCI